MRLWSRLALALLAMSIGLRVAIADDDMTVTGAWARPVLGQTAATALYFTVLNDGAAPDSILSVAVADAAQTELHATVDENGVIGMRTISELPLPPGQPAVFEPKGNHVMLMGLKRQLRIGDHLAITVRFKTHAPVTVEAVVSMTAPPR